MRTLLVLALAAAGCSEPALTLTEQDAIALDFTRVDCADVGDVRVYVDKELDQAAEAGCREARFALAQARASSLVPAAAIAGDSIIAAVVERVRIAPSVPVDADEVVEGVHVTLDLTSRDFNLLVVMTPLERVVEIAPKGLRY